MSNRLAHLQGVATAEYQRHKRASAEAAEAYLACGAALVEAKAACGHGEWLPWLAATGIGERTVQRMMKLSAAGFESDTVTHLGVSECLWWMAHKETLDEVIDACAAYRREFGVGGRRRRRRSRCGQRFPAYLVLRDAPWPQVG